MPWPSDFEDILGCVDITICNVATTKTDMRTHREGLLDHLTTLLTFLAGKTRVHSDHLMSSTFSLGSEDSEELAPSCISNGFGKVMVLDHPFYVQVFNGNVVKGVSILLSKLEMKVFSLALDLQMCLCCTLSRLASSLASLLPSTHRTLLASEGGLTFAIIPGVLNSMSFTVRQERFEPDINADVKMSAGTRKMLNLFYGWLVNCQVVEVSSMPHAKQGLACIPMSKDKGSYARVNKLYNTRLRTSISGIFYALCLKRNLVGGSLCRRHGFLSE